MRWLFFLLLLVNFSTSCGFAANASECREILKPKVILKTSVNVLGAPVYWLTIDRGAGDSWSYIRTDRSIHDGRSEEPLNKLYPARMLDLQSMNGKRVLDAGMGDGSFVRELRANGIDAIGIDVALNAAQKARPEIFIEGDMRNTGLPVASVDIIFSTWSLFNYESTNRVLIKQALIEFRRILKPGGSIRIAPAGRVHISNFASVISEIPGLKINPVVELSALEVTREKTPPEL